ncbi:SGNH/GDSL hydrolase family protein [Streptomyces griseocarneus]|uniref:SGNH/GDSL hydrolase family protein n=1 Tax=Streptomyces griseocarneus TaxID=51201 RepID=UPI001CC97534|nr:SGNH/GDSL hydrolase family protein [Streptomyces griseocarneus]MBZ6475459.1 SGNH/GDSL hydrolase family protein [Streptomyces griseocarneus]
MPRTAPTTAPTANTPHRTPAVGRRRWPAAVAGALVAAALGGVTTPAHAAAPAAGSASGRYVALGDSYAAGAGVPAISGGLCLRSDHNYGHVVAATLAPAAYTDRTCAAAKVSALTTAQTDAGIVVNGPQLDAVTPDTSLVTLTVGGNNLGTSDLGFVDVVATCSALAITNPLGAPCRAHYKDTLSRRLDAAAAQLSGSLQRLRAKAPAARVLLVGYPAVLPDDAKRCLGKMTVTTGDLTYLRSVLGELNDKLAGVAAASGATYVDTTAATKGHDSCSSSPWIEGLLPLKPALPLHPNADGERAMARAVLTALAP